jgi:hypothetical protein
VGDDDRTAHDQGHGKSLKQLLLAGPLVQSLDDMVTDAIVAAKNHRSHQPQQFFGFFIQGSGLVGLFVQVEKPFYLQSALFQNFFIHFLAKTDKFFVSAQAFLLLPGGSGRSGPEFKIQLYPKVRLIFSLETVNNCGHNRQPETASLAEAESAKDGILKKNIFFLYDNSGKMKKFKAGVVNRFL